ncbi:MAG TPA: M56 family metallopeptidase [Thermoanaerobaculia bacterium]|nr:M56 family metallopeptidase [Thermoanaerobaculia bacterium]
MTTEFVLRFVANAAWQASLLAAAGLMFTRNLSPRLRVQLLACTLALCVIAPLATSRAGDDGGRGKPVAAPPIGSNAAVGIGALYAAGLLVALVRFGRSMVKARRIAAASAPIADGVFVSPILEAPVTIGRTIYLSPRIAADERLAAAALAHEEAHVHHRDYALHVALELLALPLYFHPLVHRLRRAIAEAREIACDEEAAARFGARDYAGQLVRIASLSSPHAAALGMASTAIERRVIALLHGREPRRTRSWRFAVVIVLAAACTRFDAAPAVERATLCGQWRLIPAASRFVNIQPQHFDTFTQHIEQGPTRVAVRQHRVAHGRARDVAWSVTLDGVTRPVSGIANTTGSARWRDGILSLDLKGPKEHREVATVSVRTGRLIVDGKTERGQYHTEFERIDP